MDVQPFVKVSVTPIRSKVTFQNLFGIVLYIRSLRLVCVCVCVWCRASPSRAVYQTKDQHRDIGPLEGLVCVQTGPGVPLP